MNTAAPEAPIYTKVKHSDVAPSELYFVMCNEGWRESIVCERMYEWAADWLIDQVQGKPYAPDRRP